MVDLRQLDNIIELLEKDELPPPHTTVNIGYVPECSFDTRPAIVDGKTTSGPWGFMCRACFENQGIGLGLGLGQILLSGAVR